MSKFCDFLVVLSRWMIRVKGIFCLLNFFIKCYCKNIRLVLGEILGMLIKGFITGNILLN